MKELWNKWRGRLHVKHVKNKPLQEVLRKVPVDVDKDDWNWLVKEHFSSQKFKVRVNFFCTIFVDAELFFIMKLDIIPKNRFQRLYFYC